MILRCLNSEDGKETDVVQKDNDNIAGDSTAADYDKSEHPMHGWGQMLSQLFDETVEVENKAMCGRSTKSFIDEGRLEEIEHKITEGDYLLIQFGHNDEKKEDETRYTRPFIEYKENLKIFAETAKRKEAYPVFLTPIVRRWFNEDRELTNTHGEYINAMKDLAGELNVPLIDMHRKTWDSVSGLGPEESKKLYMCVEPGRFKNYPDGLNDNTHLIKKGAIHVAGMVSEGIKELKLDIAKHIK